VIPQSTTTQDSFSAASVADRMANVDRQDTCSAADDLLIVWLGAFVLAISVTYGPAMIG